MKAIFAIEQTKFTLSSFVRSGVVDQSQAEVNNIQR